MKILCAKESESLSHVERTTPSDQISCQDRIQIPEEDCNHSNSRI